MFNLSISFGPTGTVWAFLFKEEAKARAAHKLAIEAAFAETSGPMHAVAVTDDFGQSAVISHVTGALIEDLEQIEAARIQRALVDERCKAKFMAAAKSDPAIRQAMQGGGAPILTPMGGGFRGN